VEENIKTAFFLGMMLWFVIVSSGDSSKKGNNQDAIFLFLLIVGVILIYIYTIGGPLPTLVGGIFLLIVPLFAELWEQSQKRKKEGVTAQVQEAGKEEQL
jgi:hypothetical protein